MKARNTYPDASQQSAEGRLEREIREVLSFVDFSAASPRSIDRSPSLPVHDSLALLTAQVRSVVFFCGRGISHFAMKQTKPNQTKPNQTKSNQKNIYNRNRQGAHTPTVGGTAGGYCTTHFSSSVSPFGAGPCSSKRTVERG